MNRNPCNEISLQESYDYCNLMMASISLDRQKVDKFMAEFVGVLGKKKKKKVIWRSIDSQWTPTKRD